MWRLVVQLNPRHRILLISYISKFSKFYFTQPFLSIFNIICRNIIKVYTRFGKFTQALLTHIIPCLFNTFAQPNLFVGWIYTTPRVITLLNFHKYQISIPLSRYFAIKSWLSPALLLYIWLRLTGLYWIWEKLWRFGAVAL